MITKTRWAILALVIIAALALSACQPVLDAARRASRRPLSRQPPSR